MVRGAVCLEVIEEEGLLANATKVGGDLLKGLNELGERHEIISNVRGKGLFAAFTLPDKATRDTFRMQALEDGLLALNSGSDSIRLRPCLNLSADEADEALAIFEQTTKLIESLQVA
jgi:L-lysine 6-transaminase